MLAKRIIPCLDVKDGMTVKGVNFLNLRSAGDPVELKVSVNSAALKRPGLIDEIARHFGNQVCVVAIDARFTDGKWVCYLKGGRERTDRTLQEWAHEAQERGAGEILFTSMDHDGTRNGYACDALADLHDRLQIPVIASGGCGCAAHIADAFKLGKADAALAAGIFHFGDTDIPSLKQYLRTQGLPVRL